MKTKKTKPKKSVPSPVAPLESTALTLVLAEAPQCALCSLPAAEGGTLCPTCEETDTAGRTAVPVEVVPVPAPEPVPAMTLVAAPDSEAAKIGSEVARYLKIHARKPYDKPQDVQWMIDRSRAAWHAALIETASVEVESSEAAR